MSNKSGYVTDFDGNTVLVEVFEDRGRVSLIFGDPNNKGYRIDMLSDDAFDLVDMLTLVANDVDSHTGEE